MTEQHASDHPNVILRQATNRVIALLDNHGDVDEVRVTATGAEVRGKWAGRRLIVTIRG